MWVLRNPTDKVEQILESSIIKWEWYIQDQAYQGPKRSADSVNKQLPCWKELNDL